MRNQAQSVWNLRHNRVALAGLALLLVGSFAALGLVVHHRHQAALELETAEIEMEVDARGDWQRPLPPKPPPPQAPAQAKAAQAEPISPPREVKAAWYDVPDESLAKRRAGAEELTAAHNRLPLGTLLRVTHLENGKATLVRVTDRGIRDKKIKLDLCREAAEELGMVSKGIARVKMEIVREEGGASLPESQTASPVR